jgi:hypothetical protein
MGMDSQNQKNPILSPIQVVDIVGKNAYAGLQPVPLALIEEIAEASHAHSAIIVTFGEERKAEMHISILKMGEEAFIQSLKQAVTVLINVIEDIEKKQNAN